MQENLPPRLSHPDPAERSAALETLCIEAGGGRVAAEAAALLLADPDPGVRELAARMLVLLDMEEAARGALLHISSADIKVRNLAGEALAQMGSKAVAVLSEVIHHPDKDTRKFVIDLLALLPAHDLAGEIAVHLDDTDANVVLAAVDALGALQSIEHGPALRCLYERAPLARPGIVAAIGEMGDVDDFDFFEQALTDEDPVVQLAAAEAIAGQQSPAMLDLLLPVMDRVNPMARPILLASMVEIWDAFPESVADLPPHIRNYLLEMLNDPDQEYLCAAIRGLRFFLDEQVVRSLLGCGGASDSVDLQVFKTIAAYPDAFRHLAAATAEGVLAPETGCNFALALLAGSAVDENEWPQVATFLRTHFGALEADTKLAILNVCLRMQHPTLCELIHCGLNDLDPMVRSFAADAALEVDLPFPADVNPFRTDNAFA